MVSKTKRMEYKLKKIGEILGTKALVRIGIDPEKNRLDLLSIDLVIPEETKENISEKTLLDYVG